MAMCCGCLKTGTIGYIVAILNIFINIIVAIWLSVTFDACKFGCDVQGLSNFDLTIASVILIVSTLYTVIAIVGVAQRNHLFLPPMILALLITGLIYLGMGIQKFGDDHVICILMIPGAVVEFVMGFFMCRVYSSFKGQRSSQTQDFLKTSSSHFRSSQSQHALIH